MVWKESIWKKEFEKIQKKESSLSRSKRDAVAAMQIFPMLEVKFIDQNELENYKIGSPATAEDLEAVTQETQRRLSEKFIQNSQKTE
ncbi:MAG: hypothetical protein IKA36_01365 [Clostridia bacterium]|nr:hypothetical protein [Clostridia bacterium]